MVIIVMSIELMYYYNIAIKFHYILTVEFVVTPNDGREGAIGGASSKLDKIEAAGQSLKEMRKKTGGSKGSSLMPFTV